MDCPQARSTLLASRPGRRDWAEPELRAAAAHAEDCAGCQAELRDWDRFDDALATAIRELPTPEGLAERLLAALDQADAAAMPAAASAAATASRPESTAPRSDAAGAAPWSGWRRRLRLAAAVAAGVLAIVGAWQIWQDRPAPLSLAELTPLLHSRLDALAAAAGSEGAAAPFDGRFPAPLPDAVWDEALANAPIIGVDLDGRPGHDAAARRFRAGRLQGVLTTLPRASVADPPSDAIPRRANAQYTPRPTVVWTVGEQVYVCILERGTLDDLQRHFYGGSA